LVAHCLDTKRFELVHRGVYALSRDLLSREGRWLAAVLAVGDDAALSHRSAAAHWGIRGGGERPEVTAPRRLKRRSGLILHCLPLADDEITQHDGIPVTTVARTIFDLAASLNLHALQRATREAERLRLDAGPSLPDLIERYPGRAGVRTARILFDSGWSATPTRNDFEDRFLTLVDDARLPRPEVNALIEARGECFEVDFLWRGRRLVVELDGFETHGTRTGFEEDRRRDRVLRLAGFDVFRITWRQLRDGGAALLTDLFR
jgi:hypothetical protein